MWPMPYGIEHSTVPQRRWRQPITKTRCFCLQILREPIPCRGGWENQDDNKNKTNKNNTNFKYLFFFKCLPFFMAVVRCSAFTNSIRTEHAKFVKPSFKLFNCTMAAKELLFVFRPSRFVRTYRDTLRLVSRCVRLLI